MSASHSAKKDDKQSDYIIMRQRCIRAPQSNADQTDDYYRNRAIAVMHNHERGWDYSRYSTTPEGEFAQEGRPLSYKGVDEIYIFVIIRSDNPHIEIDPETKSVKIKNTLSKTDIVYAGKDGASKLEELIDTPTVKLQATAVNSQSKSNLFKSKGDAKPQATQDLDQKDVKQNNPSKK